MAKTRSSQLVKDICARVGSEPEVISRNVRRWKFIDDSLVEIHVRSNGTGGIRAGLVVWDPSELRPGDHVREASTTFSCDLLEDGEVLEPGRIAMHHGALVAVMAGMIKLCLAKA